MQKKQLVRDEWKVLSKKFVRHHKLPHGTKLVLEHRPTSAGTRPRKARNDLTFTRHLFRGRALDADKVADLFDKYLFPALIVKPSDKGLSVKLVGPSNEEVKRPGATFVRTVRSWAPLPTPDEVEAEEQLDAEIDEIADMADLNLRGAEELRDDSERVLRGHIRALIGRYGANSFRDAVAQETGS